MNSDTAKTILAVAALILVAGSPAEGATAIAASTTLRGLTELSLHHNDIGPGGVEAIAATPALTLARPRHA